MKILIETSARHVHLCEQDLKKLFGDNAKLTKKKDLSQPGQFVCFEKVDVVGSKDTIKGVSVLGPVRKRSQVEISLTDARKIGIAAPIRESGYLDGTPGCRLIGTRGEVELQHGVIAAKRHIHIDTKTAEHFGLPGNHTVKVKIPTENRSVIFDDVVVRVNDNFKNAMHIDTDESNAAGILEPIYGEIIL